MCFWLHGHVRPDHLLLGMTTNHDFTTGSEEVNDRSMLELTSLANPRLVSLDSHEAKIESFLSRVLPVVADRATHPIQALVPWVCDVLNSKKSLEVYGQDIRDFVRHMERFGIEPLAVKSDHLQLYKGALRDSGLAGATIARKLSVIRGMYRQFAKKKLISWETAQDIAAVESPEVQKNTTPALSEQQAVRLLHAPDTTTLIGLRDKALLHTLFITACRVSAITKAKVGHLEFDGTEWFLNVIEKRNKRQRKILLEAARSILDYLTAANIAEDREGFLFRRSAPDHKSLLPLPLSREAVWRIVKRNCLTAGISPDRLGSRGIGVHSLRKTALNNAIQNGAQLHEVRELAGHADVRTTELYFVRKEQDAERAARRIAIR